MGTPPRTVIHGIDESVPAHTKLPDHGEGKGPGEGAKCFDEELLTNHVHTVQTNQWHPMEYVAFEYDFSEDGGGLGYHNLGVIVPAGTILIGGVINVIDPLTSGGAATLTIRVEAAAGAVGDVINASAFAGLTLGLNAITPVYTAGTGILATRDRQIKLQILVAALTGGHFYGYLTCFRSWPSEEQSSSSLSQSSASSSASSSSSSQSWSSLSSMSSSSASASTSSSSSYSRSTSSMSWSSASSGSSSPSSPSSLSSASSQSASSSSHSISSSSVSPSSASSASSQSTSSESSSSPSSPSSLSSEGHSSSSSMEESGI